MVKFYQFFVWFFLSFLLLSAPQASFGQALKKVVVVSQNPVFKEAYSVLSADKTKKQGPYQKYIGKKNQLLTSGHYTNGQKDSTWTEYYADGETIRERGTYYQDQKVGMWEFYTPEGTLEQNYDYTYQQVLFSRPPAHDRRVFKLWSEEDDCRDTLQLEKKPMYIGGLEAMQRVVRQNLHYPPQAQKSRIGGTAWIAFLIDSEGKTSNYKIVKKLGGGCDAEALRVVKLIPSTWVPGRLEGRAVTVVCEMPVVFTAPAAPAAPQRAPQKGSKRRYSSRLSAR
ncbi:TonB family C-terminal domain-containing protein [Hymenobacter gelipurpurascens]|uniref:TonB family C-terminal domain-containing protein n=1 Tax=Hymenobacter gelipurpurascens TaxID=89968 RepID=A0A212UCZ3_9BACT|nr:energy transducer TonB [Hymenobacter gelipurpurascens]SNC75971.1 TonB family C-terminal domain-containing protein [Hymenobacter gelipurpurascens]